MILNIDTNKIEEFVNITGKVSNIIENNSIKNGIVNIFMNLMDLKEEK
ncbi:MAG: hypothetical protein R6U59_02185 [Eubacteriales bacterium]